MSRRERIQAPISVPPPARTAAPAVDPAADAAALLRRLGFATLMLLLPVAALLTRRGVVVLAPIGVALLVIAAFLDGKAERPVGALRRIALSPAGLAAGLVAGWCALSLAWTPFPAPAAERLLNILATVGVALAGYLALPERMRSANLYIVAVGVGIAALVGIGLSLTAGGALLHEDDDNTLERGLVVLVLCLWPAVAWLRSRQRDLEAFLLAVAVALAAVLGPSTMPVAALAVGAVAYGATLAAPKVGIRAAALAMAGALALAPLIPLATRTLSALVLGPKHPITFSLTIWRRIVLNDPLRLVTGHGFETALRGRFVGLLPANAPSTLLFEIWYELGVVGAWAAAFALYAGVTSAGRDHPPLAPGVMGAFAAAFALACLGIGTAQMWWFTALAVLVLIFVAAERGQFRTTRPKAIFQRAPANDR